MSYRWRGRPTPWRTVWRLTKWVSSRARSCWRTPVRLAPMATASWSGDAGPSRRRWCRISVRSARDVPTGLVGALGCGSLGTACSTAGSMAGRLAPGSIRRVRCYPRPMDLDLSPEHVLLRSTIRDFMETEVAPVIDEHEKARRFPAEIVRRLGEMGWLGIPVAEADGGAGMDTLAYAIAVEEISRVWGSLGIIVAAHTSLGCGPLMIAGTAEQKERFLRPLASGAVIGAYGLTEPGAGSDAGGTRTTARRESSPDGDSWVIDGGKRF